MIRVRDLLTRLPAHGVPSPRQAAVYVAAALSIGIIAGSAIGPGAPQAKQLLVGDASAPTGKPKGAPAPVSPSAPSELGAPSGDVAQDSPAPAAAAPTQAPTGGEAAAPTAEPSVPLSDPAPEAAPAPQAEQPTDRTDLAGTVVHTNPAAGSYTVATAQGEMIAVHAKKLPDLGVQVKASVRHLANGSMAQAKRTEEGSQRTGKLAGTVTYVAKGGNSYVVSVRGVSLLVTAPAAPVGERPHLRSLVTLGVRLEDPPAGTNSPVVVRETSLKLEGDATGPVELEGRVGDVNGPARTINLSADDRRDTQVDVTVRVPPAIDLGGYKKGDVLIAAADIDPQGAYTLSGSWQDGDVKRADDPANAQGDQKP